MDSKMFLAIFLGVWGGMSLYFMTKVIIGTIARIGEDYARTKLERLKNEERVANNTGRIIGFRPIEQSERA